LTGARDSDQSAAEDTKMDELSSGSVKANGLTFHYLEAGSGPLVLCLHGFPDHARSFRHQLPALAAAGFHAVAPFLRGYAPTEIPAAGPFQTAALARDAVALIEALSPGEPAAIFGHDWGAVAAYGAALDQPKRVRKLVTAAVPYGPQVLQAIAGDYDQMKRSWYMFFFQLPTAEMAVAHDDFRFLDRIWRDWSPGFTLPAEEMASLKQTFRQPGVLEAALGYYRHLFNPVLQSAELSSLQARILADPISVPSLVFHGAKDGCIGVGLLDGMESFFTAGVEKVVLPDAGHFLHQEKPEEVNRRLIAFLKS
jgi:pimeloyl-ACP methyl ester carboxylesterase